jgi:phosphoglycolate phosphatase-like HAD superfamily hydrolase
MKAYLFDIDGTIADLSHRLHHITNAPKDWPAFYAGCGRDTPIEHICDLAHALWSKAAIVFVSGRSDECREQTVAWMRDHKVPMTRLYMRAAGDHREDNVVKSELLDRLIADGFEPIMAFDDRNQVVKMWRERGIPCAQVAEGNF